MTKPIQDPVQWGTDTVVGEFKDNPKKHIMVTAIKRASDGLSQKDQWISEEIKNIGGTQWSSDWFMLDEAQLWPKKNDDMCEVGEFGVGMDGALSNAKNKTRKVGISSTMTLHIVDGKELTGVGLELARWYLSKSNSELFQSKVLIQGEVNTLWFDIDDIEVLKLFLVSAPNKQISVKNLTREVTYAKNRKKLTPEEEMKYKMVLRSKSMGFLYVPKEFEEVADGYLKFEEIEDPRL